MLLCYIRRRLREPPLLFSHAIAQGLVLESSNRRGGFDHGKTYAVNKNVRWSKVNDPNDYFPKPTYIDMGGLLKVSSYPCNSWPSSNVCSFLYHYISLKNLRKKENMDPIPCI